MSKTVRLQGRLEQKLNRFPNVQEFIFPKRGPEKPPAKPVPGQRIRVEIRKEKYELAVYVGRSWPLFAALVVPDSPHLRIKRRSFSGRPRVKTVREQVKAINFIEVLAPAIDDPRYQLAPEQRLPANLDYLYEKVVGRHCVCCRGVDIRHLVQRRSASAICMHCNTPQPEWQQQLGFEEWAWPKKRADR